MANAFCVFRKQVIFVLQTKKGNTFLLLLKLLKPETQWFISALISPQSSFFLRSVKAFCAWRHQDVPLLSFRCAAGHERVRSCGKYCCFVSEGCCCLHFVFFQKCFCVLIFGHVTLNTWLAGLIDRRKLTKLMLASSWLRCDFSLLIFSSEGFHW